MKFCIAAIAAISLGSAAFASTSDNPFGKDSAVLSLSGQFLMSWAYARAEAQYLIPTEYSAFIWAIALGWFFFDEALAWTTLAGACLIVAGCLIAARANPRLAEPIEATV